MSKEILFGFTTEQEPFDRLSFVTSWLSQAGVHVEAQEICTTPDRLAQDLVAVGKNVRSVRFSNDLAAVAFEATQPSKTALSIIHGQCDAMVRVEDKLWHSCYGQKALVDLIQLSIGEIDSSSRAIVVGECPFAKLALYGLSQMGFRNLELLATDLGLARKMAAEFSKRNFGIQLEVIPSLDITLQSSDSSILINTVREQDNPELIEDLCYFNFLKPNGVVVNLFPELLTNPLISEAREVNMQVIPGPTLQGRIDHLWLGEIYPEACGQWDNYLTSWKAHLDGLPK